MKPALFPDLIVNGEVVPHSAVAAEAQNHKAPKGKPGIAWRKAANALAIRALLLQEARRRKLKPDPVEVETGRFETDEEALVRGLLDEAVVVETPKEEEIRKVWKRDPSRFRAPPLWEVSHILVSCDPDDAEETRKAKVRATVVAAFAVSDPQGFPGLAKRESDCPSKADGGALGQLGPGDSVPEFEKALRTLAAGKVTTKPVLTRFGWHIIKMDEAAEGGVLPFKAVKKELSEAIEKASWVREARTFVKRLVEASEIAGVDLKQAVPVGAEDEYIRA